MCCDHAYSVGNGSYKLAISQGNASNSQRYLSCFDSMHSRCLQHSTFDAARHPNRQSQQHPNTSLMQHTLHESGRSVRLQKHFSSFASTEPRSWLAAEDLSCVESMGVHGANAGQRTTCDTRSRRSSAPKWIAEAELLRFRSGILQRKDFCAECDALAWRGCAWLSAEPCAHWMGRTEDMLCIGLSANDRTWLVVKMDMRSTLTASPACRSCRHAHGSCALHAHEAEDCRLLSLAEKYRSAR